MPETLSMLLSRMFYVKNIFLYEGKFFFFAFFFLSPNLAFEIILSWFDVPCNSHNWYWKQCVKRRENLHVFLKLDVEMCVVKGQVLIQTKSHRLKLIVVFFARKASFALSIILISYFPSRKKIKRLHFLHNFLNKINDALHTMLQIIFTFDVKLLPSRHVILEWFRNESVLMKKM